MFQLRRSALRLLSTASQTSFIAKPRTFTSFTPSSLRIPRQSTSIVFQRRWATSEAEVKEESEEAPISEIQPTPQEEVENAINADNAAEVNNAGAAALSEDAVPSEQAVVDAATETESAPAEQSTPSFGGGHSYPTRLRNDEFKSAIGAPKATIYIGNLFFDVTENDLIKELARFGTILKCRLMRDSRGLSKGFGYVDFDSVEAATKAIEALNQQLFEGRRLSVQYAAYESSKAGEQRAERPNKPLNPPSKTLFIGNMSFEMTDRDLNNLFRGIRNVIDVRVAIDRRTGQPRGFAHADFVDVESAMAGMKALEGKETYGRKLRLDYSYGPSNAPRNDSSGRGGSSGGAGRY